MNNIAVKVSKETYFSNRRDMPLSLTCLDWSERTEQATGGGSVQGKEVGEYPVQSDGFGRIR